MFRETRDILDYITLVTAVASPVIAWLTAVWTVKYHQRERLEVYLRWKQAERCTGGFEDYYALAIHNKSDHTITVEDVSFVCKALFVRQVNSAWWYEDDNFPEPINLKPDNKSQIPIDFRQGRQFFEDKSGAGWLFKLFRSKFSNLEIKTTKRKFRLRIKHRMLFSENRELVGVWYL